jgi:hypothetical protein
MVFLAKSFALFIHYIHYTLLRSARARGSHYRALQVASNGRSQLEGGHGLHQGNSSQTRALAQVNR